MVFERALSIKEIKGSLFLFLIITTAFYPALLDNFQTSNSTTDEKNRIAISNKSACEKGEQADTLSPEAIDLKDAATYGVKATRFVIGLDKATSNGVSHLKELIAETGGKVVNTVSIQKEVRAIVTEVPTENASAFMEKMHGANLATYVEPRIEVAAQFMPNDPYFDSQWGLKKIQADWAWNTTVGSRDVLVAVVDTGIDYRHPDLAANYVAQGYDWVNDDPDPMDDLGHGSHVAGIIAATINNGVGMAGLAQVRIMAEKVLDYKGDGYADWVAAGIIHAVDQGAKIISMSFGGYEDSEIMHEAIKYADSAGALLVASAGNNNVDTVFYPAAYEEVIAVTATDSNDAKASFSNFGEWTELAAPGVDVFSTFLNYEYKTISGTSMASPHVSGVAALIWSAFPNQTADFVRFLLGYTADDLGQPGFDAYYGHGRINAKNAVSSPKLDHDLIAFRLETPQYFELDTVNTMTADVFNLGKTEERNVWIQLLANSSTVWQLELDSLASYGSTSISIQWMPIIEGLYNITLYVVPQPGETTVDNNLVTRFLYAGSPVKAVVLRSSDTVKEEILVNWNALNNEWRLFGDRMIYVDYLSLNKQDISYQDITITRADVLIISNAEEEEFTTREIDAIARYVHEGHGLIITGNTFSETAPNNKRLAQLVGLNTNISLHWYSGDTDLLQLLNTTHPLFNKVTDPAILPLVATTVPRALSGGIWSPKELAGGNYLARGYFNESAIVEFKGLLYFSLLLETIPLRYRHHLQLLYNAILYSRYQKPRNDLLVSLDAPRYLMPTNMTMLNATVYNAGSQNQSNVELCLSIDGDVVNMTTIAELLANASQTISYLWGATLEGRHNVSAFATSSTTEDQMSNNADSKIISVHFPRFVLWDYTHVNAIGLHKRENSLVNQMLKAEGFVVDELNSTKIDRELLTSVDILVLPTSEMAYSDSEVADILDWIDDGGIVVVVVNLGFDSTVRSLTLPYGVQIYRDELSQGFTSNIISHPVTEGVYSVYYGIPELLTVESPSQTIAWAFRDSDVFSLVSVTESGEMVVISDTHMIDNKGISRADNEQLIMNTFHWLASRHLREHDIAITLHVPFFVQKGSTALLSATVRNRGSADETNVEAYLSINATVVESAAIPYLPSGSLYTFSYAWTPAITGDFNVTACVLPAPRENFTVNNLITRSVPVLFYQLYRFPTRWVEQGEPTEWHTSDGCWSYDLPFDFPFFNNHYRTIYISSNGLITFVGPDQSHTESKRALENKLAVAPAWHKWYIDEPYGIYVGQTDSTHVIIRWKVHDNSTVADFAAELSEDGVIQFFYGYSNEFVSAVIGISNGLGYTLAEEVESLNHIRTRVFSPFEIEHEVAARIEAPSFIALGTSIVLNASVTNEGLINEPTVFLHLIVNGSFVESILISDLNPGASNRIEWLWSPTEKGQYNVTAFVTPVSGEVYLGNNLETKMVFVLSNITTVISISPQTASVGLATEFVIDINISSVQNLYCWQVTLQFNSTLITFLDAWLPSDNVFAYTIPLFPEPMIEEDHVMVGATLLGNTPSFSGVGILCKVKFRAEAVGTSLLLLKADDTFLLNPQLNIIGSEMKEGSVKILLGDFNHDGIVDFSDLIVIAAAFGSYLGQETWNPIFDLNHDSKINMRDISMVARNVR